MVFTIVILNVFAHRVLIAEKGHYHHDNFQKTLSAFLQVFITIHCQVVSHN